jgi:hypothetical protein
MATDEAPVSEMLAIVKSRQIQRAMLAEMRGDRPAAIRHFLAAAHLEVVLAEDYRVANNQEMALRSQLSAASCFWRAGQPGQADRIFDEVKASQPGEASTVQNVREELLRDYPLSAA